MFRKEVFEAKNKRLFGSVIITQPTSIYLGVVSFVVLFVVVSFYLSHYHYARKETVKGYLNPQSGVVRVYLHRSGVIGDLFVEEGTKVRTGDRLAKIVNSQSLASGSELSEELSLELEVQKSILKDELKALNILKENDFNILREQVSKLKESHSILKNMRETIVDKYSFKKESYLSGKNLFEKGYLSKNSLFSLKEDYFDAKESVERIKNDISKLELDIYKYQSKILSHPNDWKLKLSSIKRNISVINSQILEIESRHEFIEKAPESGVVTSIQANVGSKLDFDTPLLSIIPIDSPLEMVMLIPTRSSGFIKVGDDVNIRFDAFPYQKFGMLKAKVVKIDKDLLLPKDAKVPVTVFEATYQVRAKLSQQFITAYGKKFPLKVGMIGEADIILENRSLLDWLLEPIYSIKGKL